MSESVKLAVRLAVLRILDPLVKWLLQAGMGVGDLMSLVKVAYVRAAREQGLESHGESQRANASRIAVVTGLTRAEVANILSGDQLENPYRRGRQRAERVLSGWWNDPAFQDSAGRPRTLQPRGGKGSFAGLVDQYSGERSRVATILSELLRVKAIRKLADGRLQAISRTYATARWSAEGIESLGEELGEHCAALLHNLNHPERPLYARRIVNTRLDPRYLPMLLRDMEQQSETLTDSMDDALNDPQKTLKGKRDGETTSLGLALYLFQVKDEKPQEARVQPERSGRRDLGRASSKDGNRDSRRSARTWSK
jgi:hypothetical protein